MDASERRERIAEEAAEWWVTLQGDTTRAQREEYVDWLRESGLHVAEMLRIAQVHGVLKQFERWSAIPTDGDGGVIVPLPNANPPPKPRPGVPPRHRTLALVAVMLFAAVGVSTAYLISSRGQVIETARGERREVALTDGSVVHVDPETRLRVKYEPARRLVFLEHGRALFYVAKNRERPFLVTANATVVRAVGTAFAVEQQGGGVVVTVAEGRVAVAPASTIDVDFAGTAGVAGGSPGTTHLASKKTAGASFSRELGPEILLLANEQLTVGDKGRAQPVRSVNSARALSWADGRLVFENDSVERVVEQFNRYNRVQIQVRDPELAKRPISGSFNASDPESFVAFLQTVSSIRVNHEGAATVIESVK